MGVVIGIDPHKGSHTAVAIDGDEQQLGRIQVRSGRTSARAVTRMGSRVRRAGVGGRVGRWCSAICSRSSSSVRASGCWMCRRRWRRGCGCWRRRSRKKTDRHDALSIAIAALRAPRSAVGAAGGSRGRVAVAGETASGSGPGPEPQRVSVACVVDRARSGRYFQGNHGERGRRSSSTGSTPADPVAQIRHDLASEHLDDLRHLDTQMRASKRRLEAAVRRVGNDGDRHLRCSVRSSPRWSIGHTRNVDRFANRDHFAAYPAPHRSSSNRAADRSGDCR